MEALQHTRRRLAAACTVPEIAQLAVDLVLQSVPAASRAELRVPHQDRTTASAAATRRGRRPAAAGTGQARLSFPLHLRVAAEQTTTATLTVAVPAATGFDSADTATLSLLAGQVEAALTRATVAQLIGNLRTDLASSRTIGTAIGLLMATHDLTSEQAFQFLRTLSQNTNRKLVQVAAERLHTPTRGT